MSIEILDENDNSPVFVVPPTNMGLPFHQDAIKSHAFTVRENAPRYTRLSGRLEARDPDAVSTPVVLHSCICFILTVFIDKISRTEQGEDFIR